MRNKKIPVSYYKNSDTLELSKDILGKKLVTKVDNQITSGIIVESEAYLGVNDKASHAFDNKLTSRTSTMFEEGGISYIYLCYGMHSVFNIVTYNKGIPEAILIRAIKPIDGISMMCKRRNMKEKSYNLTNGPGKLSQALGITKKLNRQSLRGDDIWLEDIKISFKNNNILSSPRIGVDYAGTDAKLPYRFYIKNNKWVS